MNKYRLSMDKTVNSIDTVEIETSLSEKELDALLEKIEKTDNPTTEELIAFFQEEKFIIEKQKLLRWKKLKNLKQCLSFYLN